MDSVEISVLNILEILIIYQSLFFAFNLISFKAPTYPFNKVLALFLLTIGLNFLNMFLIQKNIILPNYNFGIIFGLLYGPLFFLYSHLLLYKNKTLKIPRLWIHFLPAGLAFILVLLKNFHGLISRMQMAITIVVVFHVLAYLLFSYIKIQKFQKILLDNYSTIESRSPKWLTTLICCVTIIISVSAIESFLPYGGFSETNNFILMLVHIFTLMMVNFIYLKGLKHPEIFEDYIDRSKSDKYISSSLTKEESLILFERLKTYMENKKPYLDFDLSLKTLSIQLSVSTRNISQAINENDTVSFYGFVNYYRLSEAKCLLTSKNRLIMRINEVMYASGFSSKSTFNNTFKRDTGFTPNEYREKFSE